MQLAVGIWALFLLLIMVLYLIDMNDRVTLLDLHENVPFNIFGLIRAGVGMITVESRTMYSQVTPCGGR